MIKEGRPGLTEQQKADMWRRWKAGYSIGEICQVLKRNSSPVYAQLAIRGGIAPPGRIRAVVLKMAEREEISRGLGSGESVRSIARRLARAPSTVSREVARHGGRARYRANHADYEASLWALRPKPCRLALNGALRKVVAAYSDDGDRRFRFIVTGLERGEVLDVNDNSVGHDGLGVGTGFWCLPGRRSDSPLRVRRWA